MTENERKAIDVLKDMIAEGQYNGDLIVSRDDEKELKTAIQALEEIQQYRAMEEKLNGISVEQVVNGFINTVEDRTEEPYERGRILTNTEADMWNEYRAIGTVKEIKIREAQFERLSERYLNDLTLLREYQAIGTVDEFKALKEDKKFLEFLYNHIPPNEMEQYLSMYHIKEKIAVNGYADQSGLMSAT